MSTIKIQKSEVMKRAWDIFNLNKEDNKELYHGFGLTLDLSIFSECLMLAHKIISSNVKFNNLFK